MSLFSNISRAQDLDKSTVKTLDLSSYLGTWYELARFDHTFERGMQEVMAFYELRDDGKIDVINSGIKNGKYKVAYGKAKLTDETGVLRVSFFGPFYSDYRVLMLDDDYEYA
ncbi:MAG: lipocalin family protein, partial [Bacteroidales bacterium]|nr:lipocalin family protein [Bacteroidales bacterium]